MYSVYLDGNLIFHPNVDGLGLTSATVTLTQDGISTFKFSMEYNHPYWGAVKKRTSLIEVYDDGYRLFAGYAVDMDIDMRNSRTVQCKSFESVFQNTVQRPYSYNGSVVGFLELILSGHNSMAGKGQTVTLGTVTVEDPNDYIVRSDTQWLTTWETLQKKCLDLLGGHIVMRYEGKKEGWFLDYLADFDTKSAQDVRFGENLLDISREESSLDVCTVLIPLGASEEDERVTISSVNDGKDYLEDTEAIERYGRIVKTHTWDDVTLPENLIKRGRDYLKTVSSQTLSLELTAIDLAHVDVEIQHIRMGTYLHVKAFEVDDYFLPTSMSINLFNPANNTIKLTAEKNTLTDYQISKENEFSNLYNKVVTVTNNAKVNAGNIATVQAELVSKITQTESSIRSDIGERLSTVSGQISDISTSFEQTKSSFEMQFNTFVERMNEMDSNSAAQFADIRKYIRFEDGNIILGEQGNELVLTIRNDRIVFTQSGTEVAYFSNSKLYVTDAEILSSLRLGNFAFTPRSNGSLAFGKVV